MLAKIREETKFLKYFEPLVVESGGELGVRAQYFQKDLQSLITQATDHKVNIL